MYVLLRALPTYHPYNGYNEMGMLFLEWRAEFVTVWYSET